MYHSLIVITIFLENFELHFNLKFLFMFNFLHVITKYYGLIYFVSKQVVVVSRN
jgi:hypothetical protein